MPTRNNCSGGLSPAVSIQRGIFWDRADWVRLLRHWSTNMDKRTIPKPSLCHPEKVEASRGMCQPCYKKWIKSTPKEQRLKPDRSGWHPKPITVSICHPPERDRGHGMCLVCYAKWYREKNILDLKKKAIEKHLKLKYGLTPEGKDAMLAAQGGGCAICKKVPSSKRATHVDHDHATGIVRGILCNICNWYLGKIDTDPDIMNRIKAYRSKK